MFKKISEENLNNKSLKKRKYGRTSSMVDLLLANLLPPKAMTNLDKLSKTTILQIWKLIQDLYQIKKLVIY